MLRRTSNLTSGQNLLLARRHPHLLIPFQAKCYYDYFFTSSFHEDNSHTRFYQNYRACAPLLPLQSSKAKGLRPAGIEKAIPFRKCRHILIRCCYLFQPFLRVLPLIILLLSPSCNQRCSLTICSWERKKKTCAAQACNSLILSTVKIVEEASAGTWFLLWERQLRR